MRHLCNISQLNLYQTLFSGQSFRWKQTAANTYTGPIGNILVSLGQDAASNRVWVQKVGPIATELSDTEFQCIRSYFNMDIDFESLIQRWSKSEPLFQKVEAFSGIRLLNQDCMECLFSFICSTNNNIPRITKLVNSLCEYGSKQSMGPAQGDEQFYHFPTVEQIAEIGESRLRDLGFGYRAKYINEAAKTILQNGGRPWVEEMLDMKYEDASKRLQLLMGVGQKVADCVALMSLKKFNAVPVDTHVYQISQRTFALPASKSLTPNVYFHVVEAWRKKYGDYAGFAQLLFFAADLDRFQVKSENETEKKRKPKTDATKEKKSKKK